MLHWRQFIPYANFDKYCAAAESRRVAEIFTHTRRHRLRAQLLPIGVCRQRYGYGAEHGRCRVFGGDRQSACIAVRSHPLQQKLAGDGDDCVCDSEVFLGAVNDGRHAGLAGGVLNPKAGQARKPGRLLAFIGKAVAGIGRELGPEIGVWRGCWLRRAAIAAGVAGFAATMALLQQFPSARVERAGGRVGEHQAECVLIIPWHPSMAAQFRELRLRRH